MTSALERLRAWLGGLFSGGESESVAGEQADGEKAGDTDQQGAETDESALRCGVCGTTASTGTENCPLCRSSDLRPAAESDEQQSAASDRLNAQHVRVSRQPSDEVDPAERLSEFRRSLEDE